MKACSVIQCEGAPPACPMNGQACKPVGRITLFLALSFLVSYVQGQETNKKVLLKIDGITWALCVPALQALLMKVHGVKKTEVDWKKGEVAVEYDPSKASPSQMVKAVNDSGVFKVKPVEDQAREKGPTGGK